MKIIDPLVQAYREMSIHKVALFYGPGDIRIDTVDKPTIPTGGMVIGVEGCAICKNDEAFYSGAKTLPDMYENFSRNGLQRLGPQIDGRAIKGENGSTVYVTGHEIVGKVVALDSSVEGYNLGDRVVVTTIVGDMDCESCTEKKYNRCEGREAIGHHYAGGFAQFLPLSEKSVKMGSAVKVRPYINIAENVQGLSLAEVISCSINAHKNFPFSEESLEYGVFVGAGFNGMLNAELAVEKGKRVLLTNRSKPRLDVAEEVLKSRGIKVGYDRDCDVRLFVHNPDDANDLGDIAKETFGRLADFSMTFTPGGIDVLRASLAVKKNGHVNLFGGLGAKENAIAKELVGFDPNDIHYKERVERKTIRGVERVFSGAYASNPNDFRDSVVLMNDRIIDPCVYVTGEVNLDGLVDALEDNGNPRNIKVVVNPWM